MKPDRKAGVDEVEREVAVGDRVHAVRGQPGEAEGVGDGHPIEGQGRAGQGARAERHLGRGRVGVHHPGRIAEKGMRVGQQVVADRDRLGALEVGVAGHREGVVPARRLRQGLDQPGKLLDDRRGGGAAVEAEVERHLVVAGAAGVEPAGAVRVDLAEPALDRGVDVLVAVGEDESDRSRSPCRPGRGLGGGG